jgi:hypothetical protein
MDMRQTETEEAKMQEFGEGQGVKVWLEECAPYPAIGEVVYHDLGDNAVCVLFGYSEDHDLSGEEVLVGEQLVEARQVNAWEVL